MLPKMPGSQKLRPFSSARAADGSDNARATKNAAPISCHRGSGCARLLSSLARFATALTALSRRADYQPAHVDRRRCGGISTAVTSRAADATGQWRAGTPVKELVTIDQESSKRSTGAI